MAPSMGEVDAMRQSDELFSRKDCWVCRYNATAFFLGRILRAFLWQLPALFYGYLGYRSISSGSAIFPCKAWRGLQAFTIWWMLCRRSRAVGFRISGSERAIRLLWYAKRQWQSDL